MDDIKIYRVDDWAYIAAKSEQEACDCYAKNYDRPDDPEDWECTEVTAQKGLPELLAAHLAEGGAVPGLIGVDAHYL